MGRIFTMQKACRRCRRWFTICGSAQMFCKNDECVRARRKEDRARLKSYKVVQSKPGSNSHLAAAVESGE